MEERLVIATVVARVAPISSHLGDRAVIRADGRMEGFIGGACSRDIIRKQALAAMRTGRPRLVRIRPDAARTQEEGDVVIVPMTCVSEGAVDVLVEPYIPPRRLLLAGFTPVSGALARLGKMLDFAVVRFVDESELRDARDGKTDVRTTDTLESYLEGMEPQVRAGSVAIAASQGHYDERALQAFLSHDLSYVGLLASAKRAAAITQVLCREGVPQERLARIHAPAGLAIGARKPAEVAVSIFAAIIEAAQSAQTFEAPDGSEAAQTAIDPVCGMEVEMNGAQYSARFEGRTYYFCCHHCRVGFEANPQRYLAVSPPA